VDKDGNNTLQIKAIGVAISTFETLPKPVSSDDDRLIDLSQTDWERSRINIRSQQVRDRGTLKDIR
jgi:hypothetical protein